MPVLFYSKKEYGNVVQILRKYEEWIGEMYKKTGLVNNVQTAQDPVQLQCQVEGHSADLDQPKDHVVPNNPNDPLKGYIRSFWR